MPCYFSSAQLLCRTFIQGPGSSLNSCRGESTGPIPRCLPHRYVGHLPVLHGTNESQSCTAARIPQHPRYSKQQRKSKMAAATLLPHKSHNPCGSETILLIHGGFSSSKEWDETSPLLASWGYHVMIPDLPAHGDSIAITPFRVDDAAHRLAELVEAKANGQAAHVVAISIGAHVAAELAARYPIRVRSLVVSGFNLFTPNLFTPLLSPLVYLMQRGSGFTQNPSAEWARFCEGHDLCL